MKPSDVGELISLAALWGTSFPFMRLGAGGFGPDVMSAVRQRRTVGHLQRGVANGSA